MVIECVCCSMKCTKCNARGCPTSAIPWCAPSMSWVPRNLRRQRCRSNLFFPLIYLSRIKTAREKKTKICRTNREQISVEKARFPSFCIPLLRLRLTIRNCGPLPRSAQVTDATSREQSLSFEQTEWDKKEATKEESEEKLMLPPKNGVSKRGRYFFPPSLPPPSILVLPPFLYLLFFLHLFLNFRI